MFLLVTRLVVATIILEKANTKTNILSKKDQMNTQDNNKDVQILKEKLWTRRMTAEVIVL